MSKQWTSTSRDGYYLTKSWRRLRESHIRANPICVMCDKMGYVVPATIVDHIIPINESNRSELFLEPTNLQSLCKSCHSFKTNRDKMPTVKGNLGKDLMDEIFSF